MDSKTFHKELVKRINEAILENKAVYNSKAGGGAGGKGIAYGAMLGLKYAIAIADALAQETERK